MMFSVVSFIIDHVHHSFQTNNCYRNTKYLIYKFLLYQGTHAFWNWYFRVFNCVIFFTQWPNFKGEVWSWQGTLTLLHIFAPVPSQKFLTSVCFVSSSPLIYFYVTSVLRGKSFAAPVYKDVLGPAVACHVVWGFPLCSMKTNGWFWFDIFFRNNLLNKQEAPRSLNPSSGWILSFKGNNPNMA